MSQENIVRQVLPADKITFFGTGFSTGDKFGTEVMRITRDGVWVNPDVAVDDTAKAVLQAIDGYVKVLVQRAVQDEREKLAQWMLERGYATGHGDTTEGLLKELDWQRADDFDNALINGVEAEREECAKLLDEMAAADKLSNYYQVAALRIRERGAP
jgi:hypothetical protein